MSTTPSNHHGHDHSGHSHPHASGTPSTGGDKLPGIKHLIAVASGKGGVGKSTVSVSLALALKAQGAKVAIVDADILGPSIPVMLGVPKNQPPGVNEEGQALPAERHGVKVISMGMLTGDDSPAILRGPMVTKYLQMFVAGVSWGELDYLILDLPPGTGDTQLTLAQSLPLTGAVIVTTPQDVSLHIARRGLRMFEKVHVPILGLVENMSTFVCPHCSHETDIFRKGGGESMSKELGVEFLGSVPLDPAVVLGGDSGKPLFVDKPESPTAKAYATIAKQLVASIGNQKGALLGSFQWDWTSNQGAPVWRADAAKPGQSPVMPAGMKKKSDRVLSILWADGRTDDHDVRDLRLACQCAVCVEEMTGKKMLDPRTVRQDVAPRTLNTVGNYAVTVAWTDGHSSGIYPYEVLRSLGDRNQGPSGFDV